MNVDVNTPIDELLETWAMYSQKLFYTMLTSQTEIDEFNKVKLVLKTKGITNLEMHNVFEKECILHYIKQGGQFEKRISINS